MQITMKEATSLNKSFWDEQGRAIRELEDKTEFYSFDSDGRISLYRWSDIARNRYLLSMGWIFESSDLAKDYRNKLKAKQQERMKRKDR
jgi:hypothetical protein